MVERRPFSAARRHVFGPEGEAAIETLLHNRPLLAFDFDGTLAPIVARPEQARASRAVVQRLQALAARWPVAVVSGRALADLRQRLEFMPTWLIGNHGAEDAADPATTARLSAALQPTRLLLQQQAATLAAAGVTVEDKGPSLALHYRLAPDPLQAEAVVHQVLAGHGADVRVFGGKRVVNITPADSPDKASAVLALAARCGAGSALFAGDDVNDEPVFVAAPPHWLTLRVGRDDTRSAARFYIDSPVEMALLLDRLLAHAAAPDLTHHTLRAP